MEKLEDSYIILKDLGNGRRQIQYDSNGQIKTTFLGANDALYKGDRVPKSYLLQILERQEKNKQTVDVRPFQDALKQLVTTGRVAVESNQAVGCFVGDLTLKQTE